MLEQIFMRGDNSNHAIRLRLIAARQAVGMQQKDVAAAIGVAKQTYHSQEQRGAPSIATGRYFYRAHDIDFNYLLNGDFRQLNGDLIDRISTELLALSNDEDHTES